MIKPSILIAVAACLAAPRFMSAHKDAYTGSSSSSSPSPEGRSLAEDPSDPNAVQGGQKKEAEQMTEEKQEKISGPTVEPEQSPGTPAWDIESQRETELFESGDVVFVREGSSTHLTAYPKHEVATRYTGITSRTSGWEKDREVTVLELDNGDTVTKRGVEVIVAPAKGGAAKTDGPSLNAHAPNESH
jgi:hypothetical protein